MANEMRLIDVNAVNWGRCPADPRLAKAWLDEAPTVDAKPVVHGYWEEDESSGYYRCNRCKDVYIAKEWIEHGKWKYCPNCGAKMDGGNEDVLLRTVR